tara:strand:+ start:47 stop:163 length:117 start_codon:yes stop_codon:yes gene_type:complete
MKLPCNGLNPLKSDLDSINFGIPEIIAFLDVTPSFRAN